MVLSNLFISRNPRESCIIGRAEIDLSSLTSDRLNQMSVALRGEESREEVCQLNLVLWVTGVNGAENCGAAGAQQRGENIGNFTVRVVQASGLGSSRLQGAFLMIRINDIDIFFRIRQSFLSARV